MSESLDVVDLSAAHPRDFVRCHLRPIGGRDTPSAHIAQVDHRYGPSSEHAWVQSLCGNAIGRAVRADESSRDCARCAAVATTWRRFR